ncbi:nitroimidazol reductase NimA-like FMN-containing flavoprotein (pyridoxamine 5'-phosphate oxidase superfamily) [Cryobacterium mesophilum]|uniref:Pyridoxamine 5'-phosphate oxidase family protein n=1 Tax=Terrimesophilobacter mesophilus TaxID=433647 RepID=A0A4R8V8S0_9MICO|nr:pyridoxamine 5'-phosphate oxidase family protein [Terrimesophilobacter mesophilus]MBB5632722.1 nitroimidazol reductase NimA-like FMN-containing flavoprotein (pyridoxamine 5'-phosphate oxidase superfamily) [Terrimesophilobacter mesophilus]TFB79524.1 pyridoxamine 5'-phosphate oxidase family protein [Terrimesophilobacter mesophilus]
MADDSVSVTKQLTVAECWSLLEKDGVGRLATATVDPVTGDVTPDIFPINFHVFQERILFRTAPGSKLIDLTEQPTVAFQTDGHRGRIHWSVVARGVARRMMFDADILESGILDLQSTLPTEKWNYVRIEVETITGIRFDAAR